MVEFSMPPSQLHEPKKILDCHELHTHHHVCCQVLVKWNDRLDKRNTWENISTLCKRLFSFVFEDKNSSLRGINVRTMVKESLIMTTRVAGMTCATLSCIQGSRRSNCLSLEIHLAINPHLRGWRRNASVVWMGAEVS